MNKIMFLKRYILFYAMFSLLCANLMAQEAQQLTVAENAYRDNNAKTIAAAHMVREKMHQKWHRAGMVTRKVVKHPATITGTSVAGVLILIGILIKRSNAKPFGATAPVDTLNSPDSPETHNSNSWLSALAEKLGDNWLGRKLMQKILANAANSELMQQALAEAAQNEGLQRAAENLLANPQLQQALSADNPEAIQQAMADALSNTRQALDNGQPHQTAEGIGQIPATANDDAQQALPHDDIQGAHDNSAAASSSAPVRIDPSTAENALPEPQKPWAISTKLTNFAGKLAEGTLGRVLGRVSGWFESAEDQKVPEVTTPAWIAVDRRETPQPPSPQPKIETLLDAVMLDDLDAVKQLCPSTTDKTVLDQALCAVIIKRRHTPAYHLYRISIPIIRQLLKNPALDINNTDHQPIQNPPSWYNDSKINPWHCPNCVSCEDYRANKQTPLMLLARNNDKALAQLFIEYTRTQKDARDATGATALIHAAQSSNVNTEDNVFNLLLDNDADPSITDNNGKGPLTYLVDHIRERTFL